MSEIRHDPVTGRSVIVAKDRAKRPHAFVSDPLTDQEPECPFCVGQESATPTAIAVYGPDPPTREEPWWVRVVPNMYPAVNLASNGRRPSPTNGESRERSLFDAEAAVGAHEVIIESPKHVISVTELDDRVMALLFHVYRDRICDLRADESVAYAMAFKNVRSAAGASLAHSHSQILATPFVPPQVELELGQAARYFDSQGRCVFCDLMRGEITSRTRVVAMTPNFLAWCPFASRCPYEVCISPRQHASHYETAGDAELSEIALLIRDVIGALEATMPDAAYNYLLHTGPLNSAEMRHYHWHVELLPRLIKFAGYEWGSGCYINPVPPEVAALNLRQALAEKTR